MCGFVGVFSHHKKAKEQRDFVLWANQTMARRGPDSEGIWSSEDMVLGFRRLAIRDLKREADQPMHSVCQRYVLVFNGELYAIESLRDRLRESYQVTFTTTSDTEVLLYALIHQGVEKTLQMIDGIFAFAFYDKSENSLVVARDRSGIKPLYILRSEEGVVISSQYDHITNHEWNAQEIDPSALKSYLQFGYIPNGYALYKDTYSLPNGSYQRFDRDNPSHPLFYYEYGKEEEPIVGLEQTIADEVSNQLVSDVPVGVFLSGGVDSPLVAQAASQQQDSISGFTIDVEDKRFSEGEIALAYAKKFEVSAYVKRIEAEDLLGLIEENIQAYSEPFNDFSSLPTLMVSRMAKEQVTVCLSGDGGDELFYGYDRDKNYFELLKRLNKFGKVNRVSLLYAIVKSRLDKGKVLPKRLLKFPSLEAYYIAENSVTDGKQMADYLIDTTVYLPKTLEKYLDEVGDKINTLEDAMDAARKIDMELQLPRILLKVDRASMYHSLEVRVPLLSKRLLSLSESYRFSECIVTRDGKAQGKYPLKALLSKLSASTVPFMSKKGFTIPLDAWLHGVLKEEVYKTLQQMPQALRPYLKEEKITHFLHKFYEQRALDPWAIWGLFTLVKWHEYHTNQYKKPSLNAS